MPVETLWVKTREEMESAANRLISSGFVCRSEGESCVVCEKRLSEIMYRAVVIMLKG